MVKQFITALLLSIFISNVLHATHIVGGELRYECIGIEQYRIDMRIYRDCEHGLPFFDNPAHVGVYRGDGTFVSNLAMNVQSADTISLADNDPCHLAPNGLCVDVGYYSKTLYLPFAASGYYFVYQRCCRNGILNNIEDPLNTGATYAVFMTAEAQQTCNSSPAWSDYPPVVICLGKPLVFNHSAVDTEGDQIVYNFCTPWAGVDSLMAAPNPPSGPPYNGVIYKSGYSAAQPMAGTPLVSIDPVTGIISGTPDRFGHFVIGVCGQEFRNGVLLSEFRRDIQFIVSSCNQSVLLASLNPVTPCDSKLSAIDLVVENGTPPYAYLWSNGETTQDLPSVQQDLAYTVTINDATGCSSTASIRGNECVWPGDANYDGIANKLDVLAIGLFYGDNGPERPGASETWIAQPAPFWSDTQASGVNTKHVDCDGDGAINVFDVNAVKLNYELSHPTAFLVPYNPSAPDLNIDLDLQQFEPGATVTASVSLGTPQIPVENAYGLAFTINCNPPEAINSITPLFNADWTGSVFGGTNNTVRLAYPPLLQPARKELAICNTDRKSIQNLFGLVGKFGFKLSDTDPGVPVTFSISDVRLIDANGIEWPVNPGYTVLETSAVHDVLNPPGTLKIFPNPTQAEATLCSSSLSTGPLVVELYDASGRLGQGLESYAQDGVALLHLPVLPGGLYWVRAFGKAGVSMGRLIVR